MTVSRRSVRLAVTVLTGLLAALLVSLAAASAAGAIGIHAHRGGANVNGVAAFPENSMSAFRHSLNQGWVIEFDLQRTADGQALVMHDGDLDRTTDCDGKVSARTLAAIQSECQLDVKGINSPKENLAPGDPLRQPPPSLAQVIELLEATGGRANIEVKGLTDDFPTEVYNQLASSKLKQARLFLQNFAAPGLAPAPAILPGASLAFLALNDGAHYYNLAEQVGASWISPSWDNVTDPPAYVNATHAAGFRVVPWTVDDATSLEAVAAAGADAVISNDPTLAHDLVGSPAVMKWQLKTPKKKVRKGKAVPVRVRVTNSGDRDSARVRVRLNLPAKKARTVGAKLKVLPRLAAGETRTVNFRVKAVKRARPGMKTRVKAVVKAVRPGDQVKPASRARKLRVVR